MNLIFPPRAARALAALLLAGASVGAGATALLEMRAEDLLPMAADMKKGLNLNPNQLLLWQQVEAKSRTLLRERQSRRERLQAGARTALAAPDVELREIGAAVDSEAASALAEEKQLRQWWLTVNDALDENQRRLVAAQVSEQLLRVAAPDVPHAPAHQKDEGGGGRHGGMGRARPGGAM